MKKLQRLRQFHWLNLVPFHQTSFCQIALLVITCVLGSKVSLLASFSKSHLIHQALPTVYIPCYWTLRIHNLYFCHSSLVTVWWLVRGQLMDESVFFSARWVCLDILFMYVTCKRSKLRLDFIPPCIFLYDVLYIYLNVNSFCVTYCAFVWVSGFHCFWR